ncbi:MAG: hypothetical protein IKU37_10215 [Candidatus Gastranaerophilales bacterium]|nr:hypothetical protein [Candidatus Gastranaerophilales bacterium]
MGWVLLSLRRNELQTSIQDKQFELLQISNKVRKLGNFSNSIGDGNITPSEIASLGTEFFGDGLDFMGYSNEAASEAASLMTDYYANAYSTVTAEQYYNNPALGAQASLYFDESGNLNTDAMYQEFYEEALEDYVNTVIAPKLNELEKELQNEQNELQTEIESMEAELETVKSSISESISNSAIQL